jgi:hypothetical protein
MNDVAHVSGFKPFISDRGFQDDSFMFLTWDDE